MLCAAATLILARSQYKSRIPNADNVIGPDGEPWPGVGHLKSSGGGARNPFGEDFQAAGFKWTTELCEKDSDGDGTSNGVELGDPSCVWQEGDVPTFDTGITHPGVAFTPGGDCNATNSTAAPPAPPAQPVGCDAYTAPAAAKTFDLAFSSYSVGPGTSYVKQVFTWPEAAGTTSDIVRFDVINEHPDVVHHMLIYKCAQDVSAEFASPIESANMACTEPIMAWAVGGKPFCTPPGIAFKLTPDDACTTDCPWILLEIHYDNPSNAEGIVDSSGMRITYALDEAGAAATVQTCADAKDAGLCTHANAEVASQASQLCAKSCTGAGSDGTLSAQVQAAATQYASAEWTASRGGLTGAGLVLMGAALPKVSVPARRDAYSVVAHVPALGSAMSAMGGSISVFAYINHMHQIGKKIWLTAKDEEQEASEVECSTAYDFDLQEAVYLPKPVEFSPTTAFELNCVYDSSARSEVTHGGDESDDEMCIVVLMYYPASPTKIQALVDTVTLGAGRGDHTCAVPGCTGGVAWGGAAGAAAGDGASSEAILLAHAAFMLVAWGVLAPFGAMMPRLWRSLADPKGAGRWFVWHRRIQLTAATLCLIGFALAVAAVDGGGLPHFSTVVDNPHRSLGLALTILMVVQPLGGLLRPHKPASGDGGAKIARRTGWEWAHRIVGYSLLLLAVVQGVYGVQLLPETQQRPFGYAAAAVVAAVAVAGAIGAAIACRRGGTAAVMNRKSTPAEISLGTTV